MNKLYDDKAKAVTLTLPLPVLKRLNREAEKKDESRSRIVTFALKRYFEDKILKKM